MDVFNNTFSPLPPRFDGTSSVGFGSRRSPTGTVEFDRSPFGSLDDVWILIGVKNRVRIFYSSQLFGINEGIELADGDFID